MENRISKVANTTFYLHDIVYNFSEDHHQSLVMTEEPNQDNASDEK